MSEPASSPEPARPGAKGRPTPKRRDAERSRRRRARTPQNRKQAVRQSRERAREERTRTRKALVSGDERNLPTRDRGPVRAYARDLVDSRRRVAELFLPGAIVVFVLNFWRDPRVQVLGMFVWILLIVGIVVDSYLVSRRLKKTVARKYPNESTKGLTSYVVLRSMQIRRLRLPPPRVKPGAKI